MEDASNQVLIPVPKPWITITVAGATAGIIVGTLTFSVANRATKLVSSGSKLTMDAIGTVAGMGVTYFVGPVTGNAVRLATKAAANTTKESIEHSGLIAAGILSAAAGAVTALSITAGSKLVEYSIKYGEKISKEVAINVAEAYLKYKMSHANYSETDDTGIVIEEDWVYLSEPPTPLEEDDATTMQEASSSPSSSLSPSTLSSPSSSPTNL